MFRPRLAPSTIFSSLLLICLSLTGGCGKGTESGTAPATPPAHSQPAPPVAQDNLNVAAAADLRFALEDVVGKFRQAHPEINANVTYGSSGNFYSQISNHAPFDLFLSADISYVKRLADQGLVEKDSEFQYAVGRIVLWAPNGSPFDPARRKMKALLDPALKTIAIGNPEHAPYGRAAEAALKTYKLWEKLEPKLVKGQDIAQAAQFVQSGSADVGIIALSLALSPGMKDSGTYFLIPLEDYPPLIQAGEVLSYAKDAPAAKTFREFMLSEPGKAILKQYGFALPK